MITLTGKQDIYYSGDKIKKLTVRRNVYILPDYACFDVKSIKNRFGYSI